MSGSSLDGLDIAYCAFSYADKSWRFTLLQKKTAPLGIWQEKLKEAIHQNDQDLELLGKEFATYLANEVLKFKEEFGVKRLDAVVSHGHTIYHRPKDGKTCQIGDGEILSTLTASPVINNLRQKDIDAGGQGAPIVPIGDLHLFKEYNYCLNLGGIANVSVKTPEGILAFDICAVNQVLNFYANGLGKDYDDQGAFARSGELNSRLLKLLNKQVFYRKVYPKSLDNSFSKGLIELINREEKDVKNALRTYTEHVADQIFYALKLVAKDYSLTLNEEEVLLITGGGAFNEFLIERMQAKLKLCIHIPDSDIINYKEAIIMAFIGLLKLRNEVNVLASVTGAKKDTVCGDYYNSANA